VGADVKSTAAGKASSSSTSNALSTAPEACKSRNQKRNIWNRQRARAKAAEKAKAVEARRLKPYKDLLLGLVSAKRADAILQKADGKFCSIEETQPWSKALVDRLGPARQELLDIVSPEQVDMLLVFHLWGPKFLMLDIARELLSTQPSSKAAVDMKLWRIERAWDRWAAYLRAAPDSLSLSPDDPEEGEDNCEEDDLFGLYEYIADGDFKESFSGFSDY
jgi:hypothetical protein